MKTVINLIKGDSVGDETDYRDSLPVNMHAVPREMFGAKGYMQQEYGLSQYGVGTGVSRGGNWFSVDGKEALYRVSGSRLIRVDASGGVTDLGEITGGNACAMPYSFNTQAIITDGKYYLYDDNLGLRQVTDPDLGSPIDCVWVDGYYFFTDGEFLFHTNLSDESQIDSLQFGTAEFMPDKTVGVGKTTDDKVVVFGRYTTEYFINNASVNFAFQRVATRATMIGLVATHAKCQIAGQWFIVGGSKDSALGVHSLDVGSSSKISTREIDKVLSQYSDSGLFDLVMEPRLVDGQEFLILHLPNETLCFNYTIAKMFGIGQAWAILKSDVVGDTQWRGKHGVYDPRRSEYTYADKHDGRLGLLDRTLATQYGNIVEWILYTPFMSIESQSIDELEIETVPGFTGSDDATVALSLTYDGLSYSKEWFELYGAPNDYQKRFIIRRLGFVRNWFGIKLRGATRSRMAFSRGFIEHG